MKEKKLACSTIASPILVCQSHRLKTWTKLLTPRDKLSPKLVASPPRKKSITISKVQILDSEEDEEITCLDEKGGGNGEEF